MTFAGWWRDAEDLDEEQQRVVALPRDGKYLVSGKPGSGKTNLLVLRAAYLIRSGLPNIKVLTWTRLINEFIASGSASHGLSTGDELQTFKSWGESALADVQMDIVLTGDFGEQIKQLSQALIGAAEALAHYDGVLIDEVQDYSDELVGLLAALAPRWFFVGDENQRLYDARDGMARARALADEEIVLPRHYRNGHRICRVAEAIHDEAGYVDTSGYDEERYPSRVFLNNYEDIPQQVAAAIESLWDQLRTYPNELLGVMVPLRDDLREVIEILRDSDLEPFCQFQTQAEFYSALDEDKPIVVSTVNAAKGVEYRAAHVLCMDGIRKFPPGKQRNLAYTAVSRAKTTLHGYYSGSILPWLRSAFLKGQDQPGAPSISDLFL